MGRRILDVNAHTTFDFLDASARGDGWTDEAVAVLDVDVPRERPDVVTLDVELDHTALESVAPHADRVELSPEQARTLAAELLRHAERAETTAEAE